MRGSMAIRTLIGKALMKVMDGLYLYKHEEVAAGPPLNKEGHEDEYFKFRQDERITFMDDLEQVFPLSKTKFCSIGSGFGGEEYLIKDKLKELVLIEPDPICCRFIQTKFGDKASLFSGYMQDYTAHEKYDIIYTSGPSNWMYSSPIDGIPDCFIEFLKTYLEPDGVFIARLYGGHFKRPIIGSNYFVKLLQKKLHRNGFVVLQYVLNERTAFLVAAAYGAHLDLTEIIFPSEDGTHYINDGNFLGNRDRMDLQQKSLTILKLSVFIPSKIAWGILKLLRESYNDILLNVKL
jgi:hypothetical protein